MRKTLKTILLAGTLLGLGIAQAQQPESSVKRHPGEHLHYTVALSDGDIGKVTNVSVHLQTDMPAPDKQPNASGQFGGLCVKSNDPKIWTCDIVIPPAIRDGNYRLSIVGVSSATFGTEYREDFHVPVVPIENENTFRAPRVTVTEQP
jgi:hypothetical protein